MDLTPLRLAQYDGRRLSVRVAHQEREKLRALATAMGCSESAVVREALEVYTTVMSEEMRTPRRRREGPPPHPPWS